MEIKDLFESLKDQITQAAGFRGDARVARETARYVTRQCAESLADFIRTQRDPISAKAAVLAAISEMKVPNADARAVWKSVVKDLETVLTIRARLARNS